MEIGANLHPKNGTQKIIRMNHKIPEINTGSTADIAFLLLIFFLLTTTFDVDKGILRKLPEWQTDPGPVDVRQRNIFEIWINASDQVMADGELISVGEIRRRTKEFLVNTENDPDLPEMPLTQIGALGMFHVTKGVISVQNSSETSYEMYIKVINELERAGMELKNEFSMKYFRRTFKDLSAVSQDLVRKARPCMISEAEPVIPR